MTQQTKLTYYFIRVCFATILFYHGKVMKLINTHSLNTRPKRRLPWIMCCMMSMSRVLTNTMGMVSPGNTTLLWRQQRTRPVQPGSSTERPGMGCRLLGRYWNRFQSQCANSIKQIQDTVLYAHTRSTFSRNCNQHKSTTVVFYDYN